MILTKAQHYSMIDKLYDRGFKHGADIVHIFAGGSALHGATGSTPGDLDICGIFIEKPIKMFGLDREEHFVTTTGDPDAKNTADDVDFQLYTLRKWAVLAANGNPTALGYLFAPRVYQRNVWDLHVAPNYDMFLASSHSKGFIGMARNQLRRLKGELGAGKHGQRQDDAGYDTKAAMHMIRMMWECLELLQEGKITYPNPQVEQLKAIRNGEWTQAMVEEFHLDLEQRVFAAEKDTHLPCHVNRNMVSSLLASVYREHWKELEL